MKKLSINITKAQLISFSVELKEDKPAVHATIGLFTDGGKKISDYSIYTDGWDESAKFDLPVELLPLIGDTMRILEGVVVRHCRDGQLALPAPMPNKATVKGFPGIPDGTEVNIVPADDQPINLDEIPF